MLSSGSRRGVSRSVFRTLIALGVLSLTLLPHEGRALDVTGVRSTATAQEGRTLSLSNYEVPSDGLLVVRVGAKAPSSRSVTFRGEEMIHAVSTEVTYFTTLSVEMFYLPVRAGETGTITVTYGSGGTDQRGLIAATVAGATDLGTTRIWTDGAVAQDNRTGPNLAEARFRSTGDSTLLSAITVFGSGIPESVGSDHALDGHPTTPERVFHEVKLQGGHVRTRRAGDHTFGFQNTNPRGFMDYAMVVASFTSVPEPGFGSGALLGTALVAGLRSRRTSPRRP